MTLGAHQLVPLARQPAAVQSDPLVVFATPLSVIQAWKIVVHSPAFAVAAGA